MKRASCAINVIPKACLLGGFISIITVLQAVAQTKPPEAKATQLAPDPQREKARLLVESLENHNPQPRIENRRPVFDAKFDWQEYDRTWNAFRSMAKQAPEAWPELILKLEDDRYSVTFESISGSLRQWDVGHACREIIGRNLAAAYYPLLVPENEQAYHRLKIPDVARDRKELKDWCEKRRHRQLYELQIECCEWAIGELSAPDDYQRIEAATRQKWITDIKRQVEHLRKTKQAVPFRGFGREEFSKFSERRASSD